MDFLTWKLRTKSERLSVIWGSKWAHRWGQIFRPYFISYKAFSTCCIPPCKNFLLVPWHFIQFPDLDLKHFCPKYMPLELNPYLSLPKRFLSVFWNPAFTATSGNTTWPWVGLGWLFHVAGASPITVNSWLSTAAGRFLCLSTWPGCRGTAEHHTQVFWLQYPLGSIIPVLSLITSPPHGTATNVSSLLCSP